MTPTQVAGLLRAAAGDIDGADRASLPPVAVVPSPTGPGWRLPAALRWGPQLGLPPATLARVLAERMAGYDDIARTDVLGDGMLECVPTPRAAGLVVERILLQHNESGQYEDGQGAEADVLPGLRPALPGSGERRPEHPVFLVLWAHARLVTVLRLGQAQHLSATTDVADLLSTDTELALLCALAAFDDDIHRARTSGGSSRLLPRVLDLARRTHAWLDACPTQPVSVDEEVTATHEARQALALATRGVLAEGLRLLDLPRPAHV